MKRTILTAVFILILLGPLACDKKFGMPTDPDWPSPTPTFVRPSATPSPSAVTSLPSIIPTGTFTPTWTHSATPSPTQSAVLSTPSLTPTNSFTPTATLTPVPPLATPTPTGTFICGFSPVTVSVPMIIYTPVPYPTYTSKTPGLSGYVIRSLADWQALYGTSTPSPASVDFNTQMILVFFEEDCCTWFYFDNVCEENSQIVATIKLLAGCNHSCPPPIVYKAVAVVVPLSSLPVVWN